MLVFIPEYCRIHDKAAETGFHRSKVWTLPFSWTHLKEILKRDFLRKRDWCSFCNWSHNSDDLLTHVVVQRRANYTSEYARLHMYVHLTRISRFLLWNALHQKHSSASPPPRRSLAPLPTTTWIWTLQIRQSLRPVRMSRAWKDLNLHLIWEHQG